MGKPRGMSMLLTLIAVLIDENFEIGIADKAGDCYAIAGGYGPGTHPKRAVMLGSGCFTAEAPMVAVHELMHLLGFSHEHSRLDAERFLRITKNHSAYPAQYDHADTVIRVTVPFDYGSVMIYDAQLAINKPNVMAAAPYNKYYVRTMGQKQSMTFYDAAMINRLYCNETCGNSKKQCSRRGYLNPLNCGKCICPSGFTVDSNCTELDNAHRCSETLTAESEEKTLKIGFKTSLKKSNCYYHIQTDRSKKIKIKVNVSDDPPRVCTVEHGLAHCLQFFLEVRFSEDLAATGARLCCKERFNAVSVRNEILLFYSGTLPPTDTEMPINKFNVTYRIA